MLTDLISNLLGGTGTAADFINQSGDNYIANQSAFDVVDNGLATKDAGTATVSSPGWMNSLLSVFNSAASVYGTVTELTGDTTKPPTIVAKPGSGAPASSSQSMSTSKSWWIAAIGVAAAIGLGLWFLLRKGK